VGWLDWFIPAIMAQVQLDAAPRSVNGLIMRVL